MRTRLFYRVLPVFSLIFTVLLRSFSAQGQSTFRIGILDAPDGPLTAGATLAINQINALGGLRGADGQNYRLDAVVQGPDVFGSLSTAISNLSNASVTAVIGPLTDALVNENMDALQRMNVPILTPALGDTLLANETSDLLFRSRAAERLLRLRSARRVVGLGGTPHDQPRSRHGRRPSRRPRSSP